VRVVSIKKHYENRATRHGCPLGENLRTSRWESTSGLKRRELRKGKSFVAEKRESLSVRPAKKGGLGYSESYPSGERTRNPSSLEKNVQKIRVAGTDQVAKDGPAIGERREMDRLDSWRVEVGKKLKRKKSREKTNAVKKESHGRFRGELF